MKCKFSEMIKNSYNKNMDTEPYDISKKFAKSVHSFIGLLDNNQLKNEGEEVEEEEEEEESDELK